MGSILRFHDHKFFPLVPLTFLFGDGIYALTGMLDLVTGCGKRKTESGLGRVRSL